MGQYINAGYENNINRDKIVAVINANSAPSKRMIQEARKDKMLVDATEGNKTKSIIVMDSGHIVASSILQRTIKLRLDSVIEE